MTEENVRGKDRLNGDRGGDEGKVGYRRQKERTREGGREPGRGGGKREENVRD